MREARTRGGRARLPAVPGRARQANLRERIQGSLGAVAAASDDARQRESAFACRSARAEVARRADGEAFLRQRRRNARGLRAAEALTRIPLADRIIAAPRWLW